MAGRDVLPNRALLRRRHLNPIFTMTKPNYWLLDHKSDKTLQFGEDGILQNPRIATRD